MENGIFHPSWQHTLPVVTNRVSPWAQLMESAILSRHSSTLISPHVEPATVKHSAQSEFKDYTCTEEKWLHKHMDIQVFKFIHNGSGHFYSVVFCQQGWIHHALQDHQNVCIKISKIISIIKYMNIANTVFLTHHTHTLAHMYTNQKNMIVSGQRKYVPRTAQTTMLNTLYWTHACPTTCLLPLSLTHTHRPGWKL